MGSMGLLIVISGPSGTGKGTVCRKLLKECKDLHLSVSVTTRQPRPGEIDGKSYFFVDKEKFMEMKERNQFLEYAEVYGNYYGTPKEYVLNMLNSGRDVLLEIDIQGAKLVRNHYPDAVYIFLSPPSLEELEKRLNKRGTENEESKAIRLKNAQIELKEKEHYNYLIINDNLDEAVDKLRSIIIAEKCRIRK